MVGYDDDASEVDDDVLGDITYAMPYEAGLACPRQSPREKVRLGIFRPPGRGVGLTTGMRLEMGRSIYSVW